MIIPFLLLILLEHTIWVCCWLWSLLLPCHCPLLSTGSILQGTRKTCQVMLKCESSQHRLFLLEAKEFRVEVAHPIGGKNIIYLQVFFSTYITILPLVELKEGGRKKTTGRVKEVLCSPFHLSVWMHHLFMATFFYHVLLSFPTSLDRITESSRIKKLKIEEKATFFVVHRFFCKLCYNHYTYAFQYSFCSSQKGKRNR